MIEFKNRMTRWHLVLPLLGIAFLQLFVATTASAQQGQESANQLFLGAFMRLQSAEDFEAKDDYFNAYGDYQKSRTLYDQLASQFPNWKPGMVSNRRVLIRRKLSELAGILERQEKMAFEERRQQAENGEPQDALPSWDRNDAVKPVTPYATPEVKTTGIRPPAQVQPAKPSPVEKLLRERITSLEKMVIGATAKKREVEKALTLSAGHRKIAEIQLEEKRGELAELRRKLAAAEETEINQALAGDKRYKDLENKVASLETELAESRAREAASEEQVKKLGAKLVEAFDIINNLEGEVVKVTRERDEVVKMLTADPNGAALKAMAMRKEELEDALKDANQAIADLKAGQQKQADDKVIAEWRKKVAVLETELREVREENDDFRREVASLRNQLESAERRLTKAAVSIDNEALMEENKTLRQIVRRQLQAQAWRGHTKRLIQTELARLEIGSRSLLRLLDKMEGTEVVTKNDLAKIQDPYIQAMGNSSGLTGAFFADTGNALGSPNDQTNGDARAALDESMLSDDELFAQDGLRFQIESMSRKAASDFKKQNFDKAAKTYALIVQADPTDIRMRCNLGVCLIKQDRFDDAQQEFREAIILDEESYFPHYMLGMTFWKKHQALDAIASIQRSIEINPHNELAHNLLGVVAMERAEFGDAKVSFDKAVELRDSYSEAHRNLAVLFSKPSYANPVKSLHHYRESLKHGAPRDVTLEDYLRYNDVIIVDEFANTTFQNTGS